MTTVPQLEAELAGAEKALRLLLPERSALNSKIARTEAQEKLLEAQIHTLTTRSHPAVGSSQKAGIISGDRFPDVSSYQPNVEWNAVRKASPVRVGTFAVVKLTEGATWTDHLGPGRLDALKALGFLSRGAYAFLHPSQDPTAQAEHFLNAGAAHLGADDVVIADLEVSDGERSSTVAHCAAAFAAELAKHTPARRWLYGGGPFLHGEGVTLSGFAAHWLAAYVNNPAPYMVFGRSRTVAWQYTDGVHGPVPRVCPGIGACDMSIVL